MARFGAVLLFFLGVTTAQGSAQVAAETCFAPVEPHLIRAQTIRHDKNCAFG